MIVLVVVAYALMFGVLAWAFMTYRKRVARPVVFGRVTGVGAIATALTFIAIVSEAFLAGGCGGPAIVVMGWPMGVRGASDEANALLAQCVNQSGLQVSVAMVVQVVALVVVAVWASKLIGEKHKPVVPYEPMYPGAVG